MGLGMGWRGCGGVGGVQAAVSQISVHLHKDSQTPRPAASQYRKEQRTGSVCDNALKLDVSPDKLAKMWRSDGARAGTQSVGQQGYCTEKGSTGAKGRASQHPCHLPVQFYHRGPAANIREERE